MDAFIDWYCSELRLALNRAAVLRDRLQLEAKNLAASTINVRLAAVRRLAYEAADTELLSPQLVAGIRRVKEMPLLGRRVGNGLSRFACLALWAQQPTGDAALRRTTISTEDLAAPTVGAASGSVAIRFDSAGHPRCRRAPRFETRPGRPRNFSQGACPLHS
jgi:hypothetical protein